PSAVRLEREARTRDAVGPEAGPVGHAGATARPDPEPDGADYTVALRDSRSQRTRQVKPRLRDVDLTQSREHELLPKAQVARRVRRRLSRSDRPDRAVPNADAEGQREGAGALERARAG